MPIINTDKTQLDIDLICQFLTNSYWGKERTREQIITSIDNTMCFGMYLEGEQIGFARVLTDKAFFAYLMDVFIIESHRGKGYSKQLLKVIFDDAELQDVRKWFLATKDAHGLYRQFGFVDAQADLYMERKSTLELQKRFTNVLEPADYYEDTSNY